MSINPLQSSPALQASAATGKRAATPSPGGGFDAVLSTLQQGGSNDASRNGLVAAELLRIEMMQTSLSLSGEDPSDRPTTLPPLANLLGSCFPAPAKGLTAAPETTPKIAQTPAATPTPQTKAPGIETSAAHYLGTPYRFGGEGSDGIDCSSMVQKVFRENGIDLPRTAREQMQVGKDVAAGDLKRGDLVFFQTYAAYPSHVGIYLGDGKMIHASSGKGEVTVSDMNSDYYRSRFLGAKRVI